MAGEQDHGPHGDTSKRNPLELNSALEDATWDDQPESVRSLLDQGAQITNLAILGACRSHNIAIFQYFQRHGWDINSRTESGDTALRLVVSNRACMQWFLQNGADPNLAGRDGATPVSTVATGSGSLAELELLLSYGARMDNLAPDILRRVMARDTDAVPVLRFLLDRGLDVNAETPYDTILHNAVRTGKAEYVKVLLGNGADRTAKNAQGQTPAEEAAQLGEWEIEALLLSS